MNMTRVEAAEEIQLLLPENQPHGQGIGRGMLSVGAAVLIVAISCLGLRLFGLPNVVRAD